MLIRYSSSEQIQKSLESYHTLSVLYSNLNSTPTCKGCWPTRATIDSEYVSIDLALAGQKVKTSQILDHWNFTNCHVKPTSSFRDLLSIYTLLYTILNKEIEPE